MNTTYDSEALISKLTYYLKKGGYFILSVFNIKHYSVILPLLFKDEFRYGEVGILDRGNIKMFTGTEIKYLLKNSGCEIREFKYTMNGEPGEFLQSAIEKILAISGSNDITPYMAYKFIIKAERR